MIRNLALLLAIIAVHVLALRWLADASRLPPARLAGGQVSLVQFPQRLPVRSAAPLVARPVAGPTRNGKAAPVRPAGQAGSPLAGQTVDATSLRVIDRDGRVLIPEAALEQFLQAGTEDKPFEIGRAGQGDMRKLLQRPSALEYRPTRFDDDWRGEQPALERILEAAVEKTTATVKIPVPGRPGAYLQCKLMLLAAGGGCGFTANDDGDYVRLDDPDTLSPEEDRQCQAWWDLIVSAKTQGEWRRTRTLYERECRKPLAQP